MRSKKMLCELKENTLREQITFRIDPAYKSWFQGYTKAQCETAGDKVYTSTPVFYLCHVSL